jgi:hypothetical protein
LKTLIPSGRHLSGEGSSEKEVPRWCWAHLTAESPPGAGLHLVARLDKLLGIRATIDDGPAFKSRRRGLMLGGVMVSLAETTLAGGDFLCGLDHQRIDTAGLRLRAVPDVPASAIVIGRASVSARRHVFSWSRPTRSS